MRIRGARAAVLGSALLLLAPAPAAAGQGCQDAPATHGDGTTVRMVDDCFEPTVLRAPSDAIIGFVNEDPEPHTITGVGPWGTGHDEVPADANIQIQFPQDGVFVYTCLIHPGMTGAIVIGDASGPGAAQGGATEVEELAPPDEPAEGSPATGPEGEEPMSPPLAWLGIAAAAIIGGSAGFILGRRRSPAPGP